MDEFKHLIRQERVTINLPTAKDYRCPNCLIYPSDNDKGYKVNKKKYPIYLNQSKGYNGSGDYHDWDEIHCCKKCKNEFYFENGAY